LLWLPLVRGFIEELSVLETGEGVRGAIERNHSFRRKEKEISEHNSEYERISSTATNTFKVSSPVIESISNIFVKQQKGFRTSDIFLSETQHLQPFST
jgi:hypothetical protein